jgi:C-terminal processing protease CtpA/Prc
MGRRTSGAASFFGVVPAGTKLTVRSPSGATRDVTVPAEADATVTSCYETFGRSRAVYAEATVRPDGVAVIRLPSFFPWDKPFPQTTDPAVLQQFIADYQAEVVAVFDTVKNAPGIVWDVRANGGGITTVGLAIASGFPTARATTVSYCRARARGGSLLPDRYAIYDVAPGGPFAYAGKVAVVADGLAYSAGDYFPYAVLRATDVPVIGSATAGAFGASGGNLSVMGPPSLTAIYDANRCLDAMNDAPLEARPPTPTIPIDYEPADLAAGKDTLLERAVLALGL